MFVEYGLTYYFTKSRSLADITAKEATSEEVLKTSLSRSLSLKIVAFWRRVISSIRGCRHDPGEFFAASMGV